MVGIVAAGILRPAPADATIEQIYTLPLQGDYVRPAGGCFHCYYDPTYGWHEGNDYNLAPVGAGGHPVAAAARGTALNCYSFSTGYFVVINHDDGRHGNGHRTRYLHFNSPALPTSGQVVARGQVIGYEGNLGFTMPPNSYNLHFETRHAATTFTCGKDGTAVDPYASNTFMWKTNPPSTARDLDFSGDGYPDVMGKETSTGTICLVRGNGAGDWNRDPPDPVCGDGTPIGFGWNVYNAILRPGDFNGDGYSDVLMRNPSYSSGTLCFIGGYRGDVPPADYWIEDAYDPACGDGTPIGNDWNFFDKIIGPGDMNGDGFNDVLGRVRSGFPNVGDLCLLRGDGHGGWIPYTWNQTCHSGTRVGTGWDMYHSLVTPSDWAGNGDSCPDVLGRRSTTPYAILYHSGSCNTDFIESSGVLIETAWNAYDWLISVGDFSGDICSDVLQRWGGGYLNMRRGNCNGGFTGTGSTIGADWNRYDWIF